ncbi:hypothetical protein ACK3TF_004595 [Chlorella vulgaris]
MEQFKAKLQEYAHCIEETYQTRKRMAELEEEIMSYLKTHDHDVVDLPAASDFLQKPELPAAQDFLEVSRQLRVGTQSSSLRNANYQIRSEPPNPRSNVGPWMNSTMEADRA